MECRVVEVLQFKFSADYGKMMAGSTSGTVPMLIVFQMLRLRDHREHGVDGTFWERG